MKFRVLHNPEFFNYKQGDDLVFDDFIAVADVDAESLEQVFELTNCITQGWWLNEGVTALIESNRRSTSVGDVIVNLDDQSAHAVCMFGFEKLPRCYDGS